MSLIQEVVVQDSQPKVTSGQVWHGSNGYSEVRVSRVTKKHIRFYPKHGGGAEFTKSRGDFLRDFVLIT